MTCSHECSTCGVVLDVGSFAYGVGNFPIYELEDGTSFAGETSTPVNLYCSEECLIKALT